MLELGYFIFLGLSNAKRTLTETKSTKEGS